MFFQPRYLKEARAMVDGANRLLRYQSDRLKPAQLADAEAAVDALRQAIKDRKPDAVRERSANLEKVIGRVIPPVSHSGWRENCEVILVAIIIAAGVRAYLVEPFKIPTGSMQPTLNGIVGVRSSDPMPNPVVRVYDFFVNGRSWFDIVAKQDDVVVELRSRSYLNYFTFTDIICENQKYTVFAGADTVRQAFNIQEGRILQKGQPIVRGYVDNGDFLLVNKLAYHFAAPKVQDVFIFRTTGIELIQRTLPPGVPSQHYIKRIAGSGGNELRINPPTLFINGAPAQGRMFQRIMSEKDGYRGYSNGNQMFNFLNSPTAVFRVPMGKYFALGDNSNNSSDSRYFGPVPERNVTGKAFVVFWPFTARWGFIE
jgi:signal peptidase I